MAKKMEYDYIVCGGGTSGCVVASRLAEDPTISVLLIEAGENCLDIIGSQMSGGMQQLLGGPHDWDFYSTPQPHAADREISLTRGKFLGGSSGINGTLCIRGTKQDYDDWGVPGWSGEEMLAAMKKAERFRGKDWFEVRKDVHGFGGPVSVEPHDLAPISEKVMESFQDLGFPLDHDMFSTGERAHGCGHAPRTVHNGVRTTAAEYTRGWESKKNFTILFKTQVSKVNLTQTPTGLRATSVNTITPDNSQPVTYTARHEIILSAGTYCTPTILLRSGIDHLIVFVPYEVPPGLTHDDKIYPPEAMKATYEEWVSKKTGILASFPFGGFAYARLDERLKDCEEWNSAKTTDRDPMGLTKNQPNIEFWSTEACVGPRELPPAQGKNAFAMVTELFSPHSRGSVTLASPDPFAKPVIDHNYLSHPLDLLVLAEGVRLGNEVVMQGRGTKDLVLGSYPEELVKHHLYTTREEWIPFVRNGATTCYRPVGTCKMGSASGGGGVDESIVVDEKLRVRGVEGLRVVDASIMPKIPNGHTCMPAYGIGELGVGILRGGGEGGEG
ncbi:hypothetical protein PRZ48_009063 [Zasmidium cellare]|uniref:Alcohol oxidase n=1 Tax=Zasmidium cellare TaxID=395010 RepID=A0ABR0EI06_ZASCE|nr:hypothetical protein PRZ48_009063 [Zasmidium cellare]